LFTTKYSLAENQPQFLSVGFFVTNMAEGSGYYTLLK